MVTKKTAAPKDTTAPVEAPIKAKAATKPKAKVAAPKEAATFKPTIAMDAPAALIEKMIRSIATRGTKLDADLHSTACACLHHADKHGDHTLLNKLILALPKSARRNALTVWALAFGKFMLNDGKEHFGKTLPLTEFQVILDKSPDTTAKFDVVGAQAKPFWEYRNVREGSTQWLYMDYIGNVMKTLSRIALDVSNPEHGKAKAALDALNAVNEALNTPANTQQPAPTQTTAPAPAPTVGMPAVDRRTATAH